MKYTSQYTLLTFYKFVDVKNPEQEAKHHLKFCKDIWMMGRIYIGTEGISATVTCNEWQLSAYKLYLNAHPLFNNPADFDIKATPVNGHKFPKMTVKVREEIVSLGKKYSKKEIQEAGNRMEIDEFKKILDEWKLDDYIILDMRNNHEYKLGHFKWAVPANTLTFKELEEKLDQYKNDFADKKIISYCTWWIRCEKSTVMLQKAWLKNTYQLDGGVVKYINTFNDGNWLGSLYVFDDRVSCYVWDKETHTIIGECCYSGKKTDNCENCRYSPCNARLIVTKKEYKKHFGFCSEECARKACLDCLVKEVDFDTMQYKQIRWKIKAHPELKKELMQMMRKHLLDSVKNIDFIIKESQKEDVIIMD